MRLTDAHQLIRQGLLWLPAGMDTDRAQAMLLAIGSQESGWRHRRQLASGPARGFWQFEHIGVTGVLHHKASADLAADTAKRLGYADDPSALYMAVEHNDTLAVVLARLALRRLREPLPAADDPEEGWRQYLAVWRPGRPKPEKWEQLYAEAWEVVG